MDDGRIAKLTAQEREVLRLVHRRLTSKEIAPLLGVRVDAVDARIKNATRKLGLPDRGKAAVLLADFEARKDYPQQVYQPPEIVPDTPASEMAQPVARSAMEGQRPFIVDPQLVAGEVFPAKEETSRNKLGSWQRLGVIAAVAIGLILAIGILVSALEGLVQLALARGPLLSR